MNLDLETVLKLLQGGNTPILAVIIWLAFKAISVASGALKRLESIDTHLAALTHSQPEHFRRLYESIEHLDDDVRLALRLSPRGMGIETDQFAILPAAAAASDPP